MKSFEKINTQKIRGNLIFLDIDGTLTYNARTQVTPEVVKKVKSLARNNRVYLCSNRNDHVRNRTVAQKVGVDYLDTNRRKPSKRIINLVERKGEPLLVIGDKFLTDGLFAKRIGAKYIQVSRIAGPQDSLLCKIVYALDDFFAKFFA